MDLAILNIWYKWNHVIFHQFHLIFMYDMRKDSDFTLLPVVIWLFQHQLLKRPFILH